MTSTDPWRIHAVEIRSVTPELEGLFTYRLKLTSPLPRDAYRFEPGQFNMLYVPGVGEAAISMSGDAESGGGWVHTVRVVGNVTGALARLQVGDQLGVRGPFGAGWPLAAWRGKDLVLVAGGLGLAPLRTVVYHVLRHRGDFGRVWLLIAARSPDRLIYRSEYADWEQHDLDVQTTVDRAPADWTGTVGVSTLLLDRLPLRDPAHTHVATCGPEVMMRYVARSAENRGIAPDRIWVSLERNMQCATGLCGHCQLGPAFVCKDGPVFRYDRMRPFLAVEAL